MQEKLEDVCGETITFASQPKKVRTSSNNVQTEPLKFSSTGSQSCHTKEAEALTVRYSELPRFTDEHEHPGLASSLRTLTPLMEAELERATRSRAFADTSSGWNEDDHPECVYTFITTLQDDADKKSLQSDVESQRRKSIAFIEDDDDIKTPSELKRPIAWNSTGWVLAVGSVRQSRIRDEPVICVWNVARPKVEAKKPHELFTNVNSPVTQLAFHPKKPPILAAGDEVGTLYVFSLEAVRSPPLISGRQRYLTSAPVSSIEWVRDTRNLHGELYLLAVLHSDGKLFIWNVDQKLQVPTYCFELLPHHAFANRKRTFTKLNVPIAGRSMSFSRLDGSQFIVGSTTGGVFKCLIPASVKKIGKADTEVKFLSPVQSAFEDHQGSAESVCCSPHMRSLFLSCSSSGVVHLSNIMENAPAKHFRPSDAPANAVRWSPTRPAVFAAACGDGNVYLYDMQSPTSIPTHVLEHEGGTPVTCVEFNPHIAGFVATVDSLGIVRIWRLPEKLSDAVFELGDQLLLQKFAAAIDNVGEN
eukprot:Rmarinus@m.27672